MYIIGFNGPPRCGKDTIANEIHTIAELNVPSIRGAASMPLRLAAFSALGLDYDLDTYERIKDEPQEVFDGQSVRRFMINYSEHLLKPIYGPDALARFFVNKFARTELKMQPGLVLLSDTGFQDEWNTMADGFGVENALLVRLSREGYSWGDDSRGYVAARYALDLANEGITRTAEVVVRYAREVLCWNI